MVPEGATCLGVEYFCFEGDEIWEMRDERGRRRWRPRSSRAIGLLDGDEGLQRGQGHGCPRRIRCTTQTYREAVAEIRGYLEHFENLKTFGRNGLHRYNNQDHSMWTAILATLSYTDGISRDVWSVNPKAEYLEEGPLAEGLADLDLVA